MARTSEAWWRAVKADGEAFVGWLLDQYRGEATAAERIERLCDLYTQPGTRPYRLLTVIAGQERAHAAWVAELLTARGIEPRVEDVPSRYWAQTLAGEHDFTTLAAVGAHAESMRLERIEVIARDPEAPADVRRVFARILPEERFHERAFRSLTTPEALEKTAGAHALGRLALGLSA